MGRRGRTPSLVSAHGAVKLDASGKKSPCKMCDEDLAKGEPCVRVANPDGMGRRTYCVGCFLDVLGQTQKDLDALRAQVEASRL